MKFYLKSIFWFLICAAFVACQKPAKELQPNVNTETATNQEDCPVKIDQSSPKALANSGYRLGAVCRMTEDQFENELNRSGI